jgi:hypothetical protein
MDHVYEIFRSRKLIQALSKGAKKMLKILFCGRVTLVAVLTSVLGSTLTASADDHPVPISGQLNEALVSATPAPDGLQAMATALNHAKRPVAVHRQARHVSRHFGKVMSE